MSYLREYIDAVLYINLDRRPDRLENITKQIDMMGLSDISYRISAVDHQTLKVKTTEYAKRQTACSKSHFKAYDFARNNGIKQYLILEDDFEVLKTSDVNGLQIIEKSLKQLNSFNWDIFYLSAKVVEQEKNNTLVAPNLIKNKRGLLTAHAYIMNENTYDKIKEKIPTNEDVEIVWDSALGDDEKLNKFIAFPLTSYPMQSTSDLDISGNMTDGREYWQKYHALKYGRKAI